MNKVIPIVAALIIFIGVMLVVELKKEPQINPTNFEECVAQGNAVMESYPRQCISKDGVNFTEDIGNEIDKSGLIRIISPRPNSKIKSPLTVTGEARGNWFFEASFPVLLTDGDGKIIAQGIATAQGDWMTSEFVPFEAVLVFTTETNSYSNRGTLILKKDNPSGLPEHDDALEVPVIISTESSGAIKQPVACTADAKICPDGSGVGRTGPKCEFSACPGSGGTIAPYDSGVTGTVMLGPTCPVMRDPPDPDCDDKPYQTSISIFRSSNTRDVFASTNSGSDGTFELSLPPGEYVLDAKGGSIMPRCSQSNVRIEPNVYTRVSVSCDTGIR